MPEAEKAAKIEFAISYGKFRKIPVLPVCASFLKPYSGAAAITHVTIIPNWVTASIMLLSVVGHAFTRRGKPARLALTLVANRPYIWRRI